MKTDDTLAPPIRLSSELRAALELPAKERGVSINSEVVSRLWATLAMDKDRAAAPESA